MDALELIQLGRQLTKIGEEAMRGSRTQALPNGPSLVLRDVFANRDSSISQIAERTGLPQSYVSESVASLTQQGMLETRADPADKRRTLVRVSADHRRTVASKAATPIGGALARALGDRAEDLDAVAGSLENLFERLVPAASGPVIEQIRPRSREPRRRNA
ncbi:MAG TPA: MarR family transcriptional regulator [Solirubrobacteraceae bacterium]|nr:MarR family transcriptional regulator [Solirubrobacteraceae bacterium]